MSKICSLVTCTHQGLSHLLASTSILSSPFFTPLTRWFPVSLLFRHSSSWPQWFPVTFSHDTETLSSLWCLTTFNFWFTIHVIQNLEMDGFLKVCVSNFEIWVNPRPLNHIKNSLSCNASAQKCPWPFVAENHILVIKMLKIVEIAESNSTSQVY